MLASTRSLISISTGAWGPILSLSVGLQSCHNISLLIVPSLIGFYHGTCSQLYQLKKEEKKKINKTILKPYYTFS